MIYLETVIKPGILKPLSPTRSSMMDCPTNCLNIDCRSLIKALKHFNIFVEKEDSKNNNYLEQAVRYGLF